MAQSTTIANAKALAVTLNSQNISGSMSSIDFNVTVANSTFFTADGDWSLSLAGKFSATGTINIYYSETSGEAEDICSAAFYNRTPVTLLFVPKGSTSGNKTWTVSVLLTGLPMQFDAGTADPIGIAVPFVTSGSLTEGTVA